MDVAERYRGCLLGIAIGDALGTTLEFKQPGTFEAVTDVIGGGPFDLAPGQRLLLTQGDCNPVQTGTPEEPTSDLASWMIC